MNTVPEAMEQIVTYYLKKHSIAREMADKNFLLGVLQSIYNQGFSDGSNAVLYDDGEETSTPDWI